MCLRLVVTFAAASGAACWSHWGMAVSTVLLRDCWQPQNALSKAFAAKGGELQVRVHMRGIGSAAGTSDPAASAAAGPAVPGQSPLQHKQQQQHLVHEQNKQAVVRAAAQTSEQHNTTNQGRMHKVPQRLIVATGANGGYYHGLTNLVGSVHFWCPECPVVVFNLGLSEEQKRTVDTWCNTTLKWRDGVKIEGVGSSHTTVPQQYAWKPFEILDAVEEYKSDAVMWLDGGSTVISPLMTTIWPLLRQDGHFMVQGQDVDFTRLCVQGTFDYLKRKREDFVNKPSYAGNTVGFVYGSEAYHKILLPWTQCAAVAECIAPPGSSTSNHRFDQAHDDNLHSRHQCY